MNFPLGFITPTERTRAQEIAHADAMNAPIFRRFAIAPTAGEADDRPRVMLRDIWRHPRYVQALGFEWLGTRQFSGSCVWAGGQDVMMTLNAIEVIGLGQPEQLFIPFGLFNYGLSRLRLGDRGPGEGSLGSTYAASCNEDGTLDAADPDLPDPTGGDGFEWGQEAEMTWSAGDRIAAKWKQAAKPQVIKSVAELRSAREIRDAIRNGYPVTFACNNFVNPDGCRVQGTGADACNVGTLDSRGGHQTKMLGTWDHPRLGLLLWNNNNWGRRAYKTDPATGLGDGCWQTEADVDRAIRTLDGEVFAYSQYLAFPAQAIPWAALYSW